MKTRDRRFGARLVGAGLIAVLSLWLFADGRAGERLAGPIEARVVDVVDGDTIVVRARIWLGQEVETRVRLMGVDAPELRGACGRERALAARARDFVRARIDGGAVVLADVRYGKYAGRVLARVRAPGGEDLSAALIATGLARAYDGRARASWCDGG
jgi:endonuclease YncB( thermonuclease family)